MIFDYSKLSPLDRSSLPKDLVKIIDYAEKIFTETPSAEALGLNESQFPALGNLSKLNMVINNPNWSGGDGVSASSTEKIAHEIGHNLSDFNHGDPNYQYSQSGLQSNEAGNVKPTKNNVLGMLNNGINMNNTHVTFSPKAINQLCNSLTF